MKPVLDHVVFRSIGARTVLYVQLASHAADAQRTAGRQA